MQEFNFAKYVGMKCISALIELKSREDLEQYEIQDLDYQSIVTMEYRSNRIRVRYNTITNEVTSVRIG